MGLLNRAKKQGEAVDTGEAGTDRASIDLTEAPPAAPGFGCPDCGGPGFLDHIDLRKGVQLLHCRACGSRWETTEALPAPG